MENATRIEKIIKKIGWTSQRKVGKEARDAATIK